MSGSKSAAATFPEDAVALNLKSVNLTDEQLLRLCADNSDLRFELTAQKELIIIPPTHPLTGWRNAQFTHALTEWALKDGSGLVFDSSTGFKLPNGAVRSPDVSWLLRSRWEQLTPEERQGFSRICPDFVAELRSDSDSLTDLRAKLEEYLRNGARLGWLIDPAARQVQVYRPGQPVVMLDNPSSVSGDPELPGFVLPVVELWQIN